MAVIYGLYSARDGEILYVGRTIRTCSIRLKEHQRDAEEYPSVPLYKWFHSQWKSGFPVRIVLLTECSTEECERVESQWINKFPKLLNERKYFTGDLPSSFKMAPPKLPGIAAYFRDNKFNVDGFIGVHRYVPFESFRVLFYTGRGVKWLRGDEIPGEGERFGSVWFPDLAAAVNARDSNRRKMMPSIELNSQSVRKGPWDDDLIP